MRAKGTVRMALSLVTADLLVGINKVVKAVVVEN